MLTVGVVVLAGTSFLTAQYLQLILGLSPLAAGLWTLPPLGAGLTRISTDGLTVVVVGLGLLFAGVMPVLAAGVDTVTSAAPPDRAGAAAALSETTQDSVAPSASPSSAALPRPSTNVPNECWQSDFTHHRLIKPDGSSGADVEIISWLDDHSRYALHVSAHPRVTGPIVLTTFRQACDLHGCPASTLTDNGMVYTTRFAGGRGGRNHLEHELRRLNIAQKNSRPNHPTTCGKVERFQQTLKKWLHAQRVQPTTIAELQALLDAFVVEYNQRRPHRSLPNRATPATAYQARPKATPTGDRSADSHHRVRHDTLSKTGSVTLRIDGRLHHIGIGRTYARTRVILLVQDLHVRVVNAATGELLKELLINPRRDYQPRNDNS